MKARITKLVKRAINYTNTHKKRTILSGVLLVFGFYYTATFLIPESVAFSYSGVTCSNRLTPLPGIQRSNDASYRVIFKDEVKLGSFAIASKKVCFDTKKAPGEGSRVVGIAPFDGPFMRALYTISAGSAPRVEVQSAPKEIATTKPFLLDITSTDVIHDYHLEVDKNKTECSASGEQLRCDLAVFDLKQGSRFDYRITRSFRSEHKQIIAKGTFTTLNPIKITNTSLRSGQIIYTRLKTITLKADKSIVRATAKLTTANKSLIDLKQVVKGNQLTLEALNELPRSQLFTLTLSDLEASDGSTLLKPVNFTFKTSGGPGVVNSSIGSGNVGQSERIVLGFDQPIDSAKSDVKKFITLNGVTGDIVQLSTTQVAVTLRNAPLCKPFTITVAKGLVSASNGASSTQGWQATSRTICGRSSVIGYSVKGRPIVAYYFGSGTSTVLFTGGMHGSEPSSTTTMQAWVAYLQTNAHKIPANKQVVVVPNTNPDGIAIGARYNARNVNIDRNFPTANWKAAIETSSGILPKGGGSSAGSEPETKALMKLTTQLRPRLEVSFHAQGSLVGANKFGNSVTAGTEYARMVGYGTMFNNAEAVMGYPMTGEYEDWMGEALNIPAILIELPTSGGNYLTSQLAALWRMVNR